MELQAFERHARADWRRIPQHFKQGIDGLVIQHDALGHPNLPDIYTMGECVTESYPSAFGSAETTRSVVVLYYGSFARIATEHEDFDWEGEIWETLTHELQHHLESLAGDDTLGDMDYAADENFKRWEGEPFDTFFYREGEPLGDGWYRVEDELFVERPIDVPSPLSLSWQEQELRVSIPEARDADVIFVAVVDDDVDVEPLTVVLVRQLQGLRAITAMLRPRAPVVVHAEGKIQ